VIAAAGCAADDPCRQGLDFTAPGGAAEWVPGGPPVDIGYQVLEGEGSVAIAVESLDGVTAYPIGNFARGTVTVPFAGLDETGAAVRPGIYQPVASFLGCDNLLTRVEGGAFHQVVVQGVELAGAPLTATTASLPLAVPLTTVARSTIEVDLVVDPDPGTAGDELVFDHLSVPGELVPVVRTATFTGTAQGGAAIPGGSYQVRAVIHARADTLVYESAGPTLTWTP